MINNYYSKRTKCLHFDSFTAPNLRRCKRHDSAVNSCAYYKIRTSCHHNTRCSKFLLFNSMKMGKFCETIRQKHLHPKHCAAVQSCVFRRDRCQRPLGGLAIKKAAFEYTGSGAAFHVQVPVMLKNRPMVKFHP